MHPRTTAAEMRLDGAWPSRLLQYIAVFALDGTGNGWRRTSGGGPARDVVADHLVQQELTAHASPPQLVVHPLAHCAISPDAAEKAYAVDMEGSPAYPASTWSHVHQFMDFIVWEPVVCLAGFTWKRRSVWLLQLDMHPLQPDILGRHMLSMAAMVSFPGSVMLVVYINQPVVQQAEHLGFEVVFDRALDDVAEELGLQPAGILGLRVAKLAHHWLRRPRASELRQAGLPRPLQDIDDFLESLPPDFIPTPIQDIPQPRSPKSNSPAGSSADGVEPMETITLERSPRLKCPSAPPSTIGGSGDAEPRSDGDDDVAPPEVTPSTPEKPRDLSPLAGSVDGPGCSTFSLIGSNLPDPDTFAVITGGHEGLGQWVPSKAVPMRSVGGVLTRSILLALKTDSSNEYKYALAKKENDVQRIVAWETGDNRELTGALEIADEARDWQWA